MNQSPYPWRAGHKGRATGEAAASNIEPRAPSMRQRVLQAVETLGSASPEMIRAYFLEQGQPELITSIRPRCSELVAQGLLEDSGLRCRAEGGMQAIRWRLVPQQREMFRGGANG